MVGSAVASLDHADGMVDDADDAAEDANDELMSAAANGASCPAGKGSILQLAAFSR
jgi:hypothetical protein